MEPRQRAHGRGEELNAVAPADAQEVCDHIGGPEELDRLVRGPVNLARGEVVQTEACVQRGHRRGFSGVEIGSAAQSPVGFHGRPGVVRGELRGEEVDLERDRHVGVLRLCRRQPTDERRGLLTFEEALPPLDDHPYHPISVARGEQLLDGVGQPVLAEEEGGGAPA